MIINVRTNTKACFRYVSFDKELIFRYQIRLDTVEVRGLTCQFNLGNERNRLLKDVKIKF